jgi:hypothetical protein
MRRARKRKADRLRENFLRESRYKKRRRERHRD